MGCAGGQADGKFGLRESRMSMDETQTSVVDELTDSDGPTFAKLMTMPEREARGVYQRGDRTVQS